MKNKRVSRTDDSQYWNDPDYHAGLAELGLEMTLPSTASPPPTKYTPTKAYSADSSAGWSKVAKVIFAPFTLIKYTVLLAIWILKGLGTWATISPLIWFLNLVLHTHFPGIEVPIVLIMHLLAKIPYNHPW